MALKGQLRSYVYKFDNIDEAFRRLKLFNKSRDYFTQKHPDSVFIVNLRYSNKDLEESTKDRQIIIEVITCELEKLKEGTQNNNIILETSSDRLLA